MHDFAVVAVFQSEAHLGEVVQDLVLSEIIIVILSFTDNFAQITTISPLHHDVQAHIPVLENFLESDDVGMVENLENFGLIFSYGPLLSRHILHVDSLDHPHFLGEAGLNEEGSARGINLQFLLFAVLLLLFFFRPGCPTGK